MTAYIVATIKPWNIDAFHRYTPDLPGEWHLVTDKDELAAKLETVKPRYIFFPHWSWIVPDEILDNHECVCFHMTDVPYGRGGSPLQNLIARGHKDTKVTALRMTDKLDAGPVYKKTPLGLEGRAQDIFERAGNLVYDLIEEIVKNEPVPEEQAGEVTEFKRRMPDMSELPDQGTLEKIYDHIRMLDADSYPHGFIEHGDFRLEFTNANLDGDEVSAKVVIKRKGQE